MNNGRTAVATISTANYWPYTAVLIESLARICPEWEVYVLALNELPESDLRAKVRILEAKDLWGSDTGLCQARFNLFEWAAASKPRLLRFLLDNADASLAVYVDSDIEFFAPPDSIEQAGSIVLTPNVAALEECASAAWERIHLQYGCFNTGFLALRDTPESRSFVDWWDARLTRYCCTDPWLDIFSDQRWLDLAPGLFPGVVVDRNPALNVATWNLAGRRLRSSDGRFWVGERPLGFFHYHRVRLGMDVQSYFAEVDNHPATRELVEEYLKKAKRHVTAGQVDSGRHDRQADGALLPPIIYRAIRDTAAEHLLPLDPREAPAGLTERLRHMSFANPRLRARLRVLAYHSAHTRQAFLCEQEIDRYQRSWLYRIWIDLWYIWHAPRQAQMPLNWTLNSEWLRRSRKGVAAILRAVRLPLQ